MPIYTTSQTPSTARTNDGSKQAPRFVIITPVRDEAQFIGELIDSIASQTIRPAEWVIVNDGSTDGTGAILDTRAKEFAWLRIVHRENRGFRKSGGGVVEAFNDGYNALTTADWEFIVKLDGDLTFSADYFEKCLDKFESDPELGIGGGDICHEVNGELKVERNPKFHVRGATKIYRRKCWEAIGGLVSAPGWDTIDEVKANMLGWRTYSFCDLQLHHHRVTGAADGMLRNRVKHGVACYVSGYHPAFVVASCIWRLVQKPYVIGSAAFFYGFVTAHWRKRARVEDPAYIAYIQHQQLSRLLGKPTIWK